MRKSKKTLMSVLAIVLVVALLPIGPLSGLFSDLYRFKVSAVGTSGSGEKPLLTIGTVSDPHTDYGLQNVDPYIRTSYITAMDALKAEGIDLLLVGGDMTSDNEAGTSVAFRWDTSVYDRTMSQYHKYSAAVSKTGKTLWACGNHDYEVGVLYDGSSSVGDYNSYKGFTDMMVDDCGQPLSLFTQSMDSSAPSTEFGDFWLGAHYVINGFDFIVINSPYHKSTYYTTGTLNWLDQTLAKIGKEKTVFITGHYPLYDNRGLHTLSDGLREENYTNFVNVLNKYNNAIYLYGHEHGGRANDQLCDSIYSTVDTFERITHYDSEGKPVTSRATNPTSFITAFMGSASFYNYSLNPDWLGASDPQIIQAMTITVYRDRIVFKMINCGEKTGQLSEPLVWSFKRDVLSTGDVVIPESPESWDLPMNWSVGTLRDANGWDIPVMGNWSIRGFSNLDTAMAINTPSSKTTTELFGANNSVKEAPRSYLGNNYNETIVQGKDKPVVANGTNGWYINYDYRWSGTIAKAGGSYIKATADKGQDGAIVFTAPTTGYYSYYELLKSANLVGGAEYRATVRKNGAIIDSFTTAESGVMKEFDGKVILNAGDMLMFAYEQTTDIDHPSDDAASCFNILRINVTKVDEVAPEVGFVENVNQWTLPTDWSTGKVETYKGWDIPKQGNWQLGGYTDLDAATPVANPGTVDNHADVLSGATSFSNQRTPWPYLGSNNNEKAPQGASNVGPDRYGPTGWYVNYNYRWGGTAFTPIKDGSGLNVVAHAGQKNVITFTAPTAGVYSYTELVTQVLFETAKSNEAVTFTATVRRNGQIIDIFVPTADAASGTLDGKIVLDAGDKLMFAFVQNTAIKFNGGNHNDNDPSCLTVKELVVKKIAEKPADYVGTIDLTPKFEMGSFTDKSGNVTLMGYQTDAAGVGEAKLYALSSWEKTVDGDANQNKWIAIDPNGKNNGNYKWGGLKSGYNMLWAISTETGLITNVGGAQETKNTAPAIVFTAPNDGLFAFNATMTSQYIAILENGEIYLSRWHDYIIMKGDGTILDFQTNEGKTANNTATSVAAYVELKKNEKVLIIKAPNAKSNQFNTSANGNASVSIYEIDHVDAAPNPNYQGNVELPMIFDGTSFTDKFGMFTLMGYNTETGAPYSEGLKMEVIDGIWYAYEPKGANAWTGSPAKDRYLWCGNVNGGINGVGGHLNVAKYGSTLAFTAPCDGMYEITATMKSAWSKANSAWSEYLITKEDGTVLAIADNEGLANNTAVTVTYTATLSKGETVYIIRRPKAGSAKFNLSCEGDASVSVKALSHTCSAETLKHVAEVPSGCEDGNREYYACMCGINYADANANEVITGSVAVPGTGHATPNEYATSQTEHWKLCANGCETVLVREAHTWKDGACTVCKYTCQHDWNAETGVCLNCGLNCDHDWANEDGMCANCGMTHTHTVTAEDATCQKAAICGTCQYEVAPINPNNHGKTSCVANGDKTHKVVCEFGCVIDEDAACVLDENNVCNGCNYDYTVEITENGFEKLFNNKFNGGAATDYEANGPAEGALDNSGAVKGEDVAGFIYGGFNLEMVGADANYVYLRHHILLDGDLVVKVNGEAVNLVNVEGNYYYFDVKVMIGDFAIAHNITVDGKTVVTASVHSYMKTAFASGELESDQTNLLKALYDWDFAVAEANK